MMKTNSIKLNWLDDRKILKEEYFPSADAEVMPGVCWGRPEEIFTPAFWKSQAIQLLGNNKYESFRLGRDVEEELTACLLGGYGIPAEIGLLAFERMVELGLVRELGSFQDYENALLEPFKIEGREVRYRFAKQKAKYLFHSLKLLKNLEIPVDDQELRRVLMTLHGVGAKTASWVVRNHLASDKVAILDIHLIRACKIMNLFPDNAEPSKNYSSLEALFLNFCEAISVKASFLDALMWDYMRKIGPTSRVKSYAPKAA